MAEHLDFGEQTLLPPNLLVGSAPLRGFALVEPTRVARMALLQSFDFTFQLC
jgi:hypothetical protein